MKNTALAPMPRFAVLVLCAVMAGMGLSACTETPKKEVAVKVESGVQQKLEDLVARATPDSADSAKLAADLVAQGANPIATVRIGDTEDSLIGQAVKSGNSDLVNTLRSMALVRHMNLDTIDARVQMAIASETESAIAPMRLALLGKLDQVKDLLSRLKAEDAELALNIKDVDTRLQAEGLSAEEKLNLETQKNALTARASLLMDRSEGIESKGQKVQDALELVDANPAREIEAKELLVLKKDLADQIRMGASGSRDLKGSTVMKDSDLQLALQDGADRLDRLANVVEKLGFANVDVVLKLEDGKSDRVKVTVDPVTGEATVTSETL